MTKPPLETYARPVPRPIDTAQNTAREITDLLNDAGFDVRHDFRNLHGDVTSSNEAFVTLGNQLRPEVLLRLAQLANTGYRAQVAVGGTDQ